MKRIAILGSTGSIGLNALNIVRHLKNRFIITGLAAHSNIDLLEKQAVEFQPKIIGVADKEKARELQKRLPHIPVIGGIEGLNAVATENEAEMVISAIAGTAGLIPTVEAIKAKKNIGLANKEVLVSGGALIMSLVRQYGVELIPIDSEHSAIFQCLKGENRKSVSRIILTASGGPFHSFSEKQLDQVTLEDALRHPKWNMGPKITIDCSTLMNKGLEVIEAHWLYDIPCKQIDVVIHPQSIIHSLVEFVDQAMLAQMSEPNMLIPIQYAMTYPERLHGSLKPFDFLKNSSLQFLMPDRKKFPCLELAYFAIEKGGSLPSYMNAAKEILVDRFFNKEIGWKDIASKLEQLMSQHRVEKVSSLEDVLAFDNLGRKEALIF